MSLDEPEHKRVLVVEDNPRLRATVREFLRWEGYEVDEAAHGLEALAVAADTRPDVIVTDLQMPVMDGATFIQRCRELPGFGQGTYRCHVRRHGAGDRPGQLACGPGACILGEAVQPGGADDRDRELKRGHAERAVGPRQSPSHTSPAL